MSTLIAGLFIDSDSAGETVSSLKEKGYTENISVIAKDNQSEVTTHQVKDSTSDGAAVGAAIGGPLGALAGLIAGAVSVAIPGGVLLVGGPLAVIWGVSGAAVGALSGGLLGALVDAGFPDNKAKMFEKHIMDGEVLVAVTADDDKSDSVEQIMSAQGAHDILSLPQ